ncbi:hypothetical protein M8J76_009762 [Diaphorina citri]|nr:hypothetical protein M8J75_003534 [Diaphorina citri]KAI5733260.1 hypothetical protein M8J76_009762 [Diaphorina citri]
MLVYYICGFSTCKDFAATSLLCEYLKTQYPDHFHYRKIVTHKACYKPFAKSLCDKFGWDEYTGSPLIWKEFGCAKGRAVFIGDENKFQELMNEIYGVETFVPCEEKLNLAKDEHNFFMETKRIEQTPRNIQRRIVCIMNAGHPATRLLMAEILLGGRDFQKKDGAEIRLLEEDRLLENKLEEYLLDVIYLNVESDTGENIICIVKSLEEGLSNCDLLILMPRAYQTETEAGFPSTTSIIENSFNSWRRLGSRLNELELSCKILLFPGENSCFNLTCLAEFVHKVRAFDIVGVTEDLGLNILSQASENTNISKEDLIKIPPVWGYIGVKHLVDICSMKYNYKRDMSDGSVYTETRKLMPYHDDLQPIWKERTVLKGNFLNQVSATVDLMNEWFSDKPTGRVFSAAVLSDGTFDIPSGLYFSQPVVCVNHEWIPYSQHPPPLEPIALDDLYSDILPTLQSFQLGRKWNAIWILGDQQSSFEFLKETSSDISDKGDVFDKPMSNIERYELKKRLGKRNQLYPESYKNISDKDAAKDSFAESSPRQEDEEAVEILWDRKEPVEMDPQSSMDFVIDEFIVNLMTKYGVEEDMDEMEEQDMNEEQEEVDEEHMKET